MAGSPNHKALVQTLQKYKNTRNKHGNLVFTGNVETRELSRFDKDMEFHTLAMYYTGVLALAFNMPMARVAAIIGGSVKQNSGASDLSEAGYWRTISSAQDYWEELLNQQLFEPEFGVQIRFKRGYRNDEIKEAQRDVQGMQVATELLRLGAVKPEYLKDRLQIPDRYWTGKVDVKKLDPMKTKMYRAAKRKQIGYIFGVPIVGLAARDIHTVWLLVRKENRSKIQPDWSESVREPTWFIEIDAVTEEVVFVVPLDGSFKYLTYTSGYLSLSSAYDTVVRVYRVGPTREGRSKDTP